MLNLLYVDLYLSTLKAKCSCRYELCQRNNIKFAYNECINNVTLPSAAMSGHRSTVELLLAVETVSTDLGVDVDAWLRDGEQKLQAWNDKYLERKSAVDSKVIPATETAPQVVELDSIFFCRSSSN